MVREELLIDKPKEPDDLEFSGFHIPYDDAMYSWRLYHDHGVLPFAGGSLEQPTWWRNMVSMIDQIFYIRRYENQDEAEAARKQRAESRG